MSAPTVVTPAAASPSPVISNSTNLTVLGGSSFGESDLSYTWSLTGSPPAGVTYSDNGDNAAKASTVTFFQSGTYHFLCTITDTHSGSITSPVIVVVNQTYTNITISPVAPNVIVGTVEIFVATANDQFGSALLTQPTFTWTVSSGGPISSSGHFTATLVGTGYTVYAQSGAFIGSQPFNVITDPNTIPPPILWDKGTLANGVIIHVLNPAHFALNQDLIKSLITPLLPAHVKVYFVFDE